MKKVCLIICSLAITGSSAAEDYFPLAIGNTWIFSYQSRSAPVVPNPPVTSDSGIVSWEILEPHFSSGSNLVTPVKQTKSLYRRTVTGGSQPEYDSVFPSPRISIDTISFQQAVITVDTLNPRADSIENAISFFGAACPVAVHNPWRSLPAELTIEIINIPDKKYYSGDRVIYTYSFEWKISSLECSCYRGKLWSFLLVPDLGPREVYISVCPGWVGASYSETWKLISHSFPATKIKDKPNAARFPEMKITRTGTTLACSFGSSAQPSSIALYSVTGREVARFTNGGHGMFIAEAGIVPSGCYVVMARTTGGIYSKKLWIGK